MVFSPPKEDDSNRERKAKPLGGGEGKNTLKL